MTERIYYTDPYATRFRARVIDVSGEGRRIALDRSAFYPASGGQPFDTGTLGGIPVVEVIDDTDHVIHVLADALPLSAGEEVEGEVDAERRLDHMQQHTGQHLLSAVLIELFGYETLSFHMGADVSTIELNCTALSPAEAEAAEKRTNELIAANRPVNISFEDAEAVTGLRKASERTGTLRIVSIDGLDRSACGGTHVRSTGEIGCVMLRGSEKIRGHVRIEFVCGLRGVRRARADYSRLTAIGTTLSSAIDDAPALVASLQERLAESEKARQKLRMEAAGFRGRELYSATTPNVAGLRVHAAEHSSMGDDIRAEAQAYTGGSRAVYLGFSRSNGAVLLAASADSGIHAGNVLKPVLTAAGGRGGGSATLAQGSAGAGLAQLIEDLKRQLSST